jgi:hypothetical protein
MPRNMVYSVPLNHDDANEYVRVRRDLEVVGARGVGMVAYEFPNNEQSREFFRSVIGKSGSGLEPAIESFLRESNLNESFLENIICNMLELDRAQRIGLVSGVYPIDIDHNAAGHGRLGDAFVAAALREAEREERVWKAIAGAEPFGKVALAIKSHLIAHYDVMEIRNLEMARQIEELLGKDDGSLVLMTGATHIPGIREVLRRDNVSVADVEDPRAVTGIWWLAYSAMNDAKGLEGSRKISGSISKYALLISINTLRSGVGGSSVTAQEIEDVRVVKTPEDAERRYEEAQRYYRNEFESSLPILRRD